MKKSQIQHLPVLSLALVILLTGCGGQGFPSQSVYSDSIQALSGVPTSRTTSESSASTSSTSASPTPIPVPSPSSTAPPISYPFKLTGSSATYTTPSANTQKILKVDITSGAPSQIGSTGYTAYYSCLQLNVTVGAQTQQVLVSYGSPSAGYCTNTKSTQLLDFSGQLTAGQAQSINVEISQPYYDNCYLTQGYGYGLSGSNVVFFPPGWGAYYGGCSMASVYSTHSVSGTIKIHTNLTQ